MNGYRYVVEDNGTGWITERWYSLETGRLVATRFNMRYPEGVEAMSTKVEPTS